MNRIILKKHVSTLYKAERLHMLQHPGICQIFILACIAADAFTLYSVFDLLLTQQTGITWVITITVASAMNIAPMLLAACLRNDELKSGAKTTLCTLLTGLFIILFAVTFSLRVTSQEQLYGSVSDLGITVWDSSTEIDSTEEGFKPTLAQNVLAVILGLEPLATSICSFVLSYESSPNRKRRYRLDLQRIETEEAVDFDEVMIQEIKADMAYDIDAYDQTQFEEMLKIILQHGELAKNKAIRLLAQYDGTPEGTSYLMEGQYLKSCKEDVSKGQSVTSDSEKVTFDKIKSIA